MNAMVLKRFVNLVEEGFLLVQPEAALDFRHMISTHKQLHIVCSSVAMVTRTSSFYRTSGRACKSLLLCTF